MTLEVFLCFHTVGWGGNELAALHIARRLCKIGVKVYVVGGYADQQLLINRELELGHVGMQPPPSAPLAVLPSIRQIHVFSDCLKLLRTPKILRRVCKGEAYAYFPFWGYEWNVGVVRFVKHILSQLLRRLLGQKLIYIRWPPEHGDTDVTIFPNVPVKLPKLDRIVPMGAPRLVCVGRIEFRQKAQDSLLKLTRIARENHLAVAEMELLFVGSGPDSAQLSNIAKPHLWVSIAPWNSGIMHYESRDVCVLASRFEGLPLVALEAICAGVPVVASQNSGLHGIIPAECIFDVDQPATFGNAVMWAISNRSLAVSIGQSIIEGFYSDARLESELRRWAQTSAPY